MRLVKTEEDINSSYVVKIEKCQKDESIYVIDIYMSEGISFIKLYS